MLEIKKCNNSDLKQCVDIFIKEYYPEPYNERWTKETGMVRLKEIFDGNEDCCFVAKDGIKIVGFILGRKYHWWDGIRVYFEEIVVSKEYQKKGAGKKLWTEFEKQLKKIKVKNACAICDNQVLEFHKKNGFEKSQFNFIEKFI